MKIITKEKSIRDVFCECQHRLEQAGVDDSRNNVLILAEHVLECGRGKLIALSGDGFDSVFCYEKRNAFFNLLDRRISREPLQYIIGSCEFMGMPFSVGQGVLIPRQDTEVLVEKALDRIKRRFYITEAGVELHNKEGKVRILDMCTGSGCIAVAVAAFLRDAGFTENDVEIVAADISEAALEYTVKNIDENGVTEMVKAVRSDLFSCINNKSGCAHMFDFILSNPPYIPTEDIETLQTEVHDEPQNALDGGDDGLDFYREIIKQGAKHLNKNGEMIFEFGINQEKELNELASKYFRQVEFFKDYAGIERVMLGCI